MKNKSTPNQKDHLRDMNTTFPKPSVHIKNRNHLRKKLKTLLEKVDTKNKNYGQQMHPKNYSQSYIPEQSNNSSIENKSINDKTETPQKNINHKPNDSNTKPNGKQKKKNKRSKTKDTSLPSNGSQSEVIKSKSPEKNKSTSKGVNSKTNVMSNKTKNNKNRKAAKSADDSCKTKSQKNMSPKQLAKSPVKPTKKKSEEREAKPIITKSKKRKPKSAVKQKKNQYVQGRGPLRPPTSESEFDYDMESSPSQSKSKAITPTPDDTEMNDNSNTGSPSKQNVSNTELALTRANNDFEASESDNSNIENFFQANLDSLYDCTSDDDTYETMSCSSVEELEEEYDDEENGEEEYDGSDYEDSVDEFSEEYSSEEEYSEEDSCDDYSFDGNDYFHCSTDDESYHPPGNAPEDVYIAKGTAVKYELADDVNFDNDSNCAQIIEMPPTPTKPTKPSSTTKNLPPATKLITKNKSQQRKDEDQSKQESDDSCPELVPIENVPNDFDSDSSSSYCSHSCSSSCGCGSSDQSTEKPSLKKKYTPMTPEIIKAKADVVDDVNKFFVTASNDQETTATANGFLKEIDNANDNSLRFKVYTINNEVLSNDSLANASSKNHKEIPKSDEESQKNEVNAKETKLSSQEVNETPKKIIEESTPVHKKVKTTHVPPSQDILPSPKSLGSTEKSSPANIKKTQIKTFFFNAVNCNQVLVLLKDPLYIYGTVKLKLLAGSLEIFGYNPKHNETLEIFSPRGYSSLKIEPTPSEEHIPINEKELLSLAPFFIRPDLEEIIAKFEPLKDSIVILERNDRSKKVNMLRKYMVEHLFPNMNAIQSDRPFYTSEFLLRCIITATTDNALFINPYWKTINVHENSKIMAIGGKSVGKSTFVRYLINKNLNKYSKMLLIDLDIGQPEIFVPQTVSATTLTAPLLGPGYFLNKQPDKSFLVGHVNVIQSIEPYIESLKALLEYCNGNAEYNDIPWIVNTMGYNKGFGDELVYVISCLLQPTNIVQFQSDREINDFNIIMDKENLKSIKRDFIGDMFKTTTEYIPQHDLTPVTSFIPKNRNSRNDWTMKAKDMRLAMVLSRLSSVMVGHAEWVTDVKPVCASIDDLHIVDMGGDQLAKEDLVHTLTGNLVYLCRMESGKAHECFGIGIVRGIDFSLKQIYLLPAFPYNLLPNVNCIAVCGTPLPSSILLNQGPKVKGSAAYVYNTLGGAASMYIKQMYNKPQQFHAGKRKSVYE